jgi:glycosyltransferase involved in cell wall biosynthesis
MVTSELQVPSMAAAPQSLDAAQPTFSAVIPVYNSAQIVAKTVARTIAVFEELGDPYEILLVNDGSRDDSWEVIRGQAEQHPHVISIDLLKNYGQHNAVLCGMVHSRGDWVITLDDDGQNPPEEIHRLVDKAREGHDLVFAQFKHKRHGPIRRLGSRVVKWMNGKVFHQPKELELTNFRIIRRDVVERMCAYRTGYPYVQGLALMFSSRRANVETEHHAREIGKSNYGPVKIAELLMRILFNYSAFPLRAVSWAGGAIALGSLALGAYFVLKKVTVGASVPGWTTVVVLLSLFNGITIAMLAMLGEYVVRLLHQTSTAHNYHVRTIVQRGGG